MNINQKCLFVLLSNYVVYIDDFNSFNIYFNIIVSGARGALTYYKEVHCTPEKRGAWQLVENFA